MSQADFDVESLADFLHLTPQQVVRLVERGNAPGRKIGGAWRFNQAEIHHWLEDRIGLSDENELADIQNALERSSGEDEAPPSIAEMLKFDAIAVPLPASTRGSVIQEMVDLAASTGLIWDPAKMIEAIRAREEMQPTALDNGVALLHPRRPMQAILGEAFLACGVTRRGIPFGSRGLTDVFFLICSIDDRGHLRTLAQLSRLISDPDLLPALRIAPDRAAAHQAIVECESRLRGDTA